VADPAVNSSKVQVRFQYIIAKDSQTLFTSPELAVDAENGRQMRRNQRLTAAKTAGRYLLEVRLSYKDASIMESVPLLVGQ
jgi:hypothetical protein